MIILDTNIISELMKPQPNEAVLAWFEGYKEQAFYTTSITVAEIYYGIKRLPEGRRKQALLAKLEQSLKGLLAEKVLSFEQPQSQIFGDIVASREKIGRPIETADAQIAAITKFHGATVVTRNTKDFEACGIKLINPFSEKRTS